MVVQMRDECCINASFLDLDRVLKELQDKVAEATESSRIGPFGIFPAALPSVPDTMPVPELIPQLEIVPDMQVIEPTGRISTPDLELSLSQFSWGELDDVQAWDTLDSALITVSRFNSVKGSVNGNVSTNWDLEISSPSESFLNEAVNALASGQYAPDLIDHDQEFDTGTGNLLNTPT